MTWVNSESIEIGLQTPCCRERKRTRKKFMWLAPNRSITNHFFLLPSTESERREAKPNIQSNRVIVKDRDVNSVLIASTAIATQCNYLKRIILHTIWTSICDIWTRVQWSKNEWEPGVFPLTNYGHHSSLRRIIGTINTFIAFVVVAATLLKFEPS